MDRGYGVVVENSNLKAIEGNIQIVITERMTHQQPETLGQWLSLISLHAVGLRVSPPVSHQESRGDEIEWIDSESNRGQLKI